jgi:prune family protein 2
LLALPSLTSVPLCTGYVGPERHALLVISACYLPPRSIPQYDTTVDHLFLYIGSVVQRLVVDDYQLVYLHSGAPQHSMPSFSLLRKFYHMLDHRLRKQLKHLYIVHPTFWVRSMLQLARPFISSKFYRKVHMVRRLDQLTVPLEHYLIPAPVLRADSAHLPHPSQPSRRYTTDKQL